MPDLGSLATRLGEAADVASAAELLAEHFLEAVPGAAARIYLLAPGDRCSACERAGDCAERDRCLHLQASLGTFAEPPGQVERIPRTDPLWRAALAPDGADVPVAPPPQLAAAPGDEHAESALARLHPLLTGGEVLGVAAMRCPAPPPAATDEELKTAVLLAAATFRYLFDEKLEGERREQLLLVSDLARKVTSILDDELLLRQAAEGIHRTFGFHNVMIFMREPEESSAAPRLRLRAQACAHPHPSRLEATVGLDEGIVGRVCRNGTTEVVSDVSLDADFVQWFPETRSEIGVPILIDSVVEGVLNVESDQVSRFGVSERLIIETIANQLAIAIENARLFGMVKQREDRYRVLVESNPGAVLHLNAAGTIVFANPAAEELTGQPRDELLRQSKTLVGLAHEDSRAALEAAVAEAFRGEARRDVEFEILRVDGRNRYVQASLQPLPGEGDPQAGVVVLIRDQTREKELQERLFQSEKLSAIGGLVSGVAHELNNPLAGILGFAQLMISRDAADWNRKDMEQIEANARRCQQIVENLLAFARQARLSRRIANLNEVIDSVLRLNEYQFHVDEIEVQRDLDRRIPPVYLDVNRWQQVFVNLATNAHQAIVSSNARTRRLRFETRLDDDRIVVRISDTGPGIPADVRARVFEPFFTTKDSGTGLGLGICYGIVTEHGGRIELEPPDEDGTCFKITLPLEARPPLAPALATAPVLDERKQTEQPEAGEGRRVLVVDDEENVRAVVARALRTHQYEVDLASDGTTALERIREIDYDAILTDVSMPGPFRGIGLYDRVVEERPELASRILFLSGFLHDDVLMAQIQARGGRFIEKPFDIHELARVVADVAGLEGGGDGGSDTPPPTE